MIDFAVQVYPPLLMPLQEGMVTVDFLSLVSVFAKSCHDDDDDVVHSRSSTTTKELEEYRKFFQRFFFDPQRGHETKMNTTPATRDPTHFHSPRR